MKSSIPQFQKEVWKYYSENSRPMPWRENTDPYYIFLSEVMLQQTQVDRVIIKFNEFIQAFPTVQHLAGASFKDVLAHWSGLGYNRRAQWLHQSAQEVVELHDGVVPNDPEVLQQLKGIGPNTASAIVVYAYNIPQVFIETNIRAAFIHYFFNDKEIVSDAQLASLISDALDSQNPREWYWALMDYGSHIKKLHKNPARRSKHHAKQSSFRGSDREIRGALLKLLLKQSSTSKAIHAALDFDTDRTFRILEDLVAEGLVAKDSSDTYSIAD